MAASIRIKKRNDCFRFEDAGDNYKFDAEKYLGETELKTYAIQLIADNDPQSYLYVLNNYCHCRFVEFAAKKLTSQIYKIKQAEHSLKKLKSKHG